MHQPDDKRKRNEVAAPLPLAWQRVLGQAEPAVAGERSVLGFFLEAINDDHEPAARLDVAPVLLTLGADGRYSRPIPLDSRHLPEAPLTDTERRLAATLLGLPQTLRKSRSYARFAGSLGDHLLADILDAAPCFFI